LASYSFSGLLQGFSGISRLFFRPGGKEKGPECIGAQYGNTKVIALLAPLRVCMPPPQFVDKLIVHCTANMERKNGLAKFFLLI
jgi:hypothetical protein